MVLWVPSESSSTAGFDRVSYFVSLVEARCPRQPAIMIDHVGRRVEVTHLKLRFGKYSASDNCVTKANFTISRTTVLFLLVQLRRHRYSSKNIYV